MSFSLHSLQTTQKACIHEYNKFCIPLTTVSPITAARNRLLRTTSKRWQSSLFFAVSSPLTGCLRSLWKIGKSCGIYIFTFYFQANRLQFLYIHSFSYIINYTINMLQPCCTLNQKLVL